MLYLPFLFARFVYFAQKYSASQKDTKAYVWILPNYTYMSFRDTIYKHLQDIGNISKKDTCLYIAIYYTYIRIFIIILIIT